MTVTAPPQRGNALDIEAVPVVRLAAMTRDEVDNLTEADRQLRRELLLADTTEVYGPDIPGMFDTDSRAGYAKWRNNYLETGVPGAHAFIRPVNEDKCARPGVPRKKGMHPPKYLAGLVREWGCQTGRLDPDFFPVEGGRGGRYQAPAESRAPVTSTRSRVNTAAAA